MASSSSATPDTLINLKVNHDGVSKKMKLPLRDLGASTLEDKLRALLSITPGTECLIERYSDSAASYVVLDPSNVSVYKQLYRAAKAKQKLKLRVATMTKPDEAEEKEEEPKVVPKPVTVEDVPEGPEPTEAKAETKNKQCTVCTDIPAPTTERRPREWQFAPEDELRAHLANLARNHEELEKNISQLEASIVGLAKQTSLMGDVGAAVNRNVVNNLGQIPVNICSMPRYPEPPRPQTETPPAAHRATFAVCCNSCDRTIPDSHYHCSSCDEGDFDLCPDCVEMGVTCFGADHWLIKRFVKNGMIINSTTERIAPKPKPKPQPQPQQQQQETAPQAVVPPQAKRVVPVYDFHHFVRTCNNCVGELPESEFVHCTTCYDFDLCKPCFAKNEHGHHPKHAFVPAVAGTPMPTDVSQRLSPGRNQKHNAICDGCDKFITGIRHKCLDCPDWDYCSSCAESAGFIHPNHRFVPIYEPIAEARQMRPARRATHYGIRCDGPLCNSTDEERATFVVGDRYKCAVCHDTDFCANCEASPVNHHNKTHPLIKFKTPVRHVSVSTTGEHEDGKRLPQMGDRTRHSFASSQSRATETTLTAQDIAINSVQTVVDVKPSEPEAPVKVEEQVEQAPAVQKTPAVDELVAVYERDTVPDGTELPPNHVFEQTWVLRNAGTVAWPAGCSVKFVGGDYMGHVDSNHPAGIHELVSASESTVCYESLTPGQEFQFTVLLRTPARPGKVISYWRLTTREGLKFGHRLWCDVDVQDTKSTEEPKVEIKQEPEDEETPSLKSHESQMIFPKLKKESPMASVYEDDAAETDAVSTKAEVEVDDFEDCEDDEWAEDDSEGFMTDEEYDILDASDEEYLEEQQKKLLKK